MSSDNFSILGYDAWKTRAPEDEPGYWDDKEPEEDDHLGSAYNDGWNDAIDQVVKMLYSTAAEVRKLRHKEGDQ